MMFSYSDRSLLLNLIVAMSEMSPLLLYHYSSNGTVVTGHQQRIIYMLL
jgi:hypothetical protein